jgi:MFS family permease
MSSNHSPAAGRDGTIPLVSSESRSGWRTRLAGLRLDLTPLRTSRDFRVLFVAGFVFFLGAMVGYVAVPFQLYALTGSNFAVGAYGLVQLVPLVLAGLYGGALADRLDRRRVLVLTGVAQVAGTAVLLANALAPHPSVPVVYGVGVVMAVAQSLQSPSREALVPRTVRHAELPAAVALSSVGAQVGMLGGPALGGVLLAWVGPPWAFGVTLVGFAGATALFGLLRPYPPLEEPSATGTLREIREGVVYAARRPDLLGTYVVDLVAMFLAMPVVLFPALAAEVLARPALLGLLYSAGTVGSLLATATSGWTARVHHHGRAVVLSAAAWGASVVLAGLTTVPAVVLIGLVLAGAFDMISGLFRGTIWHQTIPDSHRGRLAGIEMLSYTVGPLGGEARAGLVADATSVRTAIVSGGVLCVAGVAVTAAALRSFWDYDVRTDEHAARERQLRAAREAAG